MAAVRTLVLGLVVSAGLVGCGSGAEANPKRLPCDPRSLRDACASAPWAQQLRFRPLQGWRAGANGTFDSSYGPVSQAAAPKESTAWMTSGVAYRDRRTADPPEVTLTQLPPRGVLVFAVIYESGLSRGRPIVLRLDRATRYPCCDGTYVAGGEFALAGVGPGDAYAVNVRVYFGSRPTRSMRAQAQNALDHLQLPSPR